MSELENQSGLTFSAGMILWPPAESCVRANMDRLPLPSTVVALVGASKLVLQKQQTWMLVTATKRHLGSLRRVGKACKTLHSINKRSVTIYM